LIVWFCRGISVAVGGWWKIVEVMVEVEMIGLRNVVAVFGERNARTKEEGAL
jgi:hypothetical protein